MFTEVYFRELKRISLEHEHELLNNETIYNVGHSMSSLLEHGKQIGNIKNYNLDLFEFKNNFGVNSNINYVYRIHIEDINGNKQTSYLELV